MIINLILISQEAAIYIKQHSPSTHINITSRQKKHRKKYYVEESKKVFQLIKEFEEQNKNITKGGLSTNGSKDN